MRFFVNCDPPKSLSKNNKRAFLNKKTGRAVVVNSDRQTEAKATILQLFAQHAPEAPLTGPVVLSLVFMYPFPKSTSKRELAEGARPMVVKPDADGIASGVMDCLTTLRFWLDDAQVYCLHVEKWQSAKSGILVEITEDKSQSDRRAS